MLTPLEKLEAHQRGLRHKAVSVFVLDGTRLLIQRRALGKYHTPGLWANTCCTHLLWDEPGPNCARPRLAEEMVEPEMVEMFRAFAGADLPLALAPDEVMAARWADFFNLRAEISADPQAFTPRLRIYLERLAGLTMLSGWRQNS